jgi:cyclopropane-fatty-acyl-phospholipid synthase
MACGRAIVFQTCPTQRGDQLMSSGEITNTINQTFHTTRGWQHRLISRRFANITYGQLTIHFKDGTSVRINGSQNGPCADITFHSLTSTLLKIWWKGDLGFAESYLKGQWDSSNLTQLMYFLSRNINSLGALDSRSRLQQWLAGTIHYLNSNTMRGSKRNIAAHYDLGNDFYMRWLDKSMTYSSALFDTSSDIDKAQLRKYERIFELIKPEPGDHILEIGCGWGGFAEYAASRGCLVTGITLSEKQLEFARQRIYTAGLDDRVFLQICDYRELDMQYDHIVSIEMIEAVGQTYWQTYFETLMRSLKPNGNIVIQSITIDEGLFHHYADNPGGFIQRYIFPGGMLPTIEHLERLSQNAGLKTIDRHTFGQDYATTLSIWHERFHQQEEWLEQNGYDNYFRRMWRYYLSFCEAGFRDECIDVAQLHLRHAA